MVNSDMFSLAMISALSEIVNLGTKKEYAPRGGLSIILFRPVLWGPICWQIPFSLACARSVLQKSEL
jgi:hypothetical protein